MDLKSIVITQNLLAKMSLLPFLLKISFLKLVKKMQPKHCQNLKTTPKLLWIMTFLLKMLKIRTLKFKKHGARSLTFETSEKTMLKF